LADQKVEAMPNEHRKMVIVMLINSKVKEFMRELGKREKGLGIKLNLNKVQI